MNISVRMRSFYFYAVIFLLGMILLPSFPVYSEQIPVIRAGLYHAQRYSYVNSDGSFAGADVEYAYRIAQKAGFKIEITLFENEASMLKSLDDGATDMLFDFGKIPDLAAHHLFSESKIGSSALTVYARSDDDRFVYGDIEQLKQKIFGFEQGNNLETVFTNWCKQHGFVPDLKPFHDTAEIDKVLNEGKIDAAVIGENGHKGYTTILTFSPRAYYIMFRKSDTALKSKVDAAMSSILTYDPLFEEKLLKKYNITTFGITGFSREEKKFITTHPSVRIAVIRNDEPYYTDLHNGKYVGIIPSYYNTIAEFLGVNFSYQVYESTPDAISALKSGGVDALAMFSDGIIVAEQSGILLTNAYENVDSVLIMRSGMSSSDIKKIAVKQRSLHNARQGILSVVNASVVPALNAKEEFALLSRGGVDAIICGQPTATWLLNQTNSAGYSTTVLSSLQFDLCGAVAPGNTTLLSILDKAIAATNYRFESIVEDNTRQQHTLQSFVARIPARGIVGFALVTLFMITVLTVAIVLLLKSRRTRLAAAFVQADAEQRRIQAEAAEKNAEEKNTFFSNISHDMRTPLNAVIGFTRLAQRSDISEAERNEYLQKTEMSGILLLDLINDTLTISKVTSGKMQLRLQPCRAADLIETVTSSVRTSAEKKHITFTVDDSGIDGSWIAADKLNVEKIFLNLLTNAIKYTPDGGHVWYTASKKTESDGRICFVTTVRDDGIGISSEFLPHIYEPFSQEKRTGYDSAGTGLGLSIVQQLVSLMGGTITVKSEKDKGTTFTVTLCFDKVNPVNTVRREIPVHPSETFAGKKVLLCEDNPLNREIAVTLLHDCNVETDCAENGQIGVEKFTQSAPGEYAAIFMDLRMPVKDGYEATQAIRSLSRADAKTIPIIAMTADAFEEDVQKCIDVGMNGHLSKPVDPQQLYQLLAAYI